MRTCVIIGNTFERELQCDYKLERSDASSTRGIDNVHVIILLASIESSTLSAQWRCDLFQSTSEFASGLRIEFALLFDKSPQRLHTKRESINARGLQLLLQWFVILSDPSKHVLLFLPHGEWCLNNSELGSIFCLFVLTLVNEKLPRNISKVQTLMFLFIHHNSWSLQLIVRRRLPFFVLILF